MLPATRRLRVSSSRSIPAPVDGLSSSESWANMPEKSAIRLENLFPDLDRVILRGGSITRFADLGGPVQTLMTYAAVDGASELFAAAGSGVFDVTPGIEAAVEVVADQASAKWEWINFGTLGGQYLIAVNGEDDPLLYDGTTWSTTGITGVTETTLTWVQAHQRRLWFGQAQSLTVWYLEVDSIAGAATAFYLGPVARKGGYVVAMGTWTRDSGSGPDDVAVFMTSEGELLVYQGTDPASANTWGLVGVYDVGRPIGRRCMVKFGGDLLILTENGLLPLTKATTVERSQQSLIAFSSNINRLMNEHMRQYGAEFGWQAVVYPRGRMVIVNAPGVGSTVGQYVFNALNGAACQFTGLQALCWGIYQDRPFFGTAAGDVIEFDVGGTDNDEPIYADVIQAFNYFGNRGSEKAFKRVSPVFLASANPNPSIQLYTDFNVTRFTASPTLVQSTDAKWGVAKWGVDKWGTTNKVWTQWTPVSGTGRAATIRMRFKLTKGAPAWMSTNWTYLSGGSL